MSSSLLPVVGNSGAVQITATDEVQADSVARRDASKDLYTRIFRSSGDSNGIRTAGHLWVDIQNKSSAFTVDESTNNGTIYTIDTSGGSVTVTLPAAAAYTDKVLCFVKTSASNTLTIDGDGTEEIGGLSTTAVATANNAFIWIVCNGTKWIIVGWSAAADWA
jgi:hypothetical protein